MTVGYRTLVAMITGESIQQQQHTSSQNSADPQAASQKDQSLEISIADLLCSILTCAFAVALLFFAIFHLHLVLTGQTTIEVKQQHSKHASLQHPNGTASSATASTREWTARQHPASRRDNFCAVFGDRPLYWFLPINTVDPYGGYSFDFQFAVGDEQSEDESDIEAGLARGTARSAIYAAVGSAASVQTHNVNPLSALATISAQKLHSHEDAALRPMSSTNSQTAAESDRQLLLSRSQQNAESLSGNSRSLAANSHHQDQHDAHHSQFDSTVASRSPIKQ